MPDFNFFGSVIVFPVYMDEIPRQSCGRIGLIKPSYGFHSPKRLSYCSPMVYEERTYTLHPGTAPAFLKEYQEHGMRTHQRHLGEQVGFFATDVGVLNQVVQIFAFLDAGDRQKRREALYADPEWVAFVPILTRYVQHMESRLLIPAGFSKLT